MNSLLLLAAAAGSDPAPGWIHCTPTSIEVAGGPLRPAQNPIARALDNAGPGSVIYLDPGDYPSFSIGLGSRAPSNADTSGGEPGRPIVVEGTGRARILGHGDAIAIDQKRPCGNITFRGLEIVPGERAAVMFFRQHGEGVHRGFSFEDCHVLGGFDHAKGRGRRSKWGVWGHSLADFRFAGVRAPARVEGIEKEHGFYLQNLRGAVTIENVEARELGRTFLQVTARASEGPPGAGDVTVRDCVVEDVGLAAGDAHKGGSAFTFAGRITGTILLERNVYRAGFRPALRSLTRGGAPYGTGAVAAWQGGEKVRNDVLILRDNRFLFADGCGDRPVVSIGGCRRVLIVGKNELRSGGDPPALALDPVDAQGNLVSSPNGSVYLAPTTRLQGGVTRRGEPLAAKARARLERGS